MAHPIHQANKNSPYGILTREEFHSKHHIIHHQSFMSNNQNMKIFTQSWRPDHHHPTGLRGIVAMIHGYTAETSWLLELTAVAIAKTGFLVCALDLQGHGYSAKKMKPVWPIEKLLPIAACIAPKWKIVITRPPESISYKEAWKRKLVEKSPNRGRLASGKPLAATAMEFLRVCEFIERNCCELEVPVLVVHGGNDKVCDPNSAKKFYESVASKDKSLKIVEGMWHMLIGEPNETVELVFGSIIMSWIVERAERKKHKINTDRELAAC